MKKIDINVPVQYRHLSEWTEFGDILPEGHIILNKNITGCGCTVFFLTNDKPVILASPRISLIKSKLKDKNIKRELFYFDRSDGNKDLSETIAEMDKYLLSCGPNPFNDLPNVPKILSTFDSLFNVLSALRARNMLDQFTIVVDEWTCIFTDVRMKGSTVINFLHTLKSLPNRIVNISATPLNMVYLDLMEEFRGMEYVTLEWDPSMKEDIDVVPRKMRSTVSAIDQIIQDYRQRGFFNTLDGESIYSTEAVFFLNSVRDICTVIDHNKLKPSETLVICAEDKKNRTALRSVGHSIGAAPGEDEYKTMNKPFTFVTKCSFEGTDFYSDCSTTYVFGDSNKEHLQLDLSIDLPQIAGRCRTKTNPFRKEIFYYYKNTSLEKGMDEKQMIQKINDKRNDTLKQVEQLSDITDLSILDNFVVAQDRLRYTKSYLDVERIGQGSGKAICNDLAYIADLRAVEIKMEQYKSKLHVLNSLDNNGFNPIDMAKQEYQRFREDFFKDDNFEHQMKAIVDAVERCSEVLPMIETSPSVPTEFKKYYRELGPEQIKKAGYIEANLKRLLSTASKISGMSLNLKTGDVYTNAELKTMIQAEYDRLSIIKTAKATDITQYAHVQKVKLTRDGKRINCYKIIELK